jgi:hypothetical protein
MGTIILEEGKLIGIVFFHMSYFLPNGNLDMYYGCALTSRLMIGGIESVEDFHEQDVDDPEVQQPEVQEPEADPAGSDLTVDQEMVLSSSQSLQQTNSEANVSFMLKVL